MTLSIGPNDITARVRVEEYEKNLDVILATLVVNLLPDLARKGRQYGAELVDLYGPSREEVPRRPDLIAAR